MQGRNRSEAGGGAVPEDAVDIYIYTRGGVDARSKLVAGQFRGPPKCKYARNDSTRAVGREASRWRKGTVASLVRVLAAVMQAYERARVARCLTATPWWRWYNVPSHGSEAVLCACATGTTVSRQEVIK